MKLIAWIVWLSALLASVTRAPGTPPPAAASVGPLALIQTISLPDVRGRIDHLALDEAGQRLFMAALGNDTVEVVDLTAPKRLHTLRDCSTPQGLAYVPGANRLFIANGGSGSVQMLDGSSFNVLKSLKHLPDADNVRYDAKAGLIYVGYGDGALAVIGATNGELIATIPLAGHPESFQLEENGNRIFVNVPGARQIAVVDRNQRTVTATWPLKEFHSNYPMALDEKNHRLFVGCRSPARLLVMDTATGKSVTDLKIASDTDDVFYDADRQRIYVSCGGGFIDVIDQRDSDRYELRAQLPTVSGARTSFFSARRSELYLAVRAGIISGSAEIRIFKCEP